MAIQSPGFSYDVTHALATPDNPLPVILAHLFWNLVPRDGDTGPLVVRNVLMLDHNNSQWPDTPQSCCAGALRADWVNADKGMETPEGVFGAMLARGFENQYELWRALQQFARIGCCLWAQRMLYAMDRILEEPPKRPGG
jgi:hypothetical protein